MRLPAPFFFYWQHLFYFVCSEESFFHINWPIKEYCFVLDALWLLLSTSRYAPEFIRSLSDRLYFTSDHVETHIHISTIAKLFLKVLKRGLRVPALFSNSQHRFLCTSMMILTGPYPMLQSHQARGPRWYNNHKVDGWKVLWSPSRQAGLPPAQTETGPPLCIVLTVGR